MPSVRWSRRVALTKVKKQQPFWDGTGHLVDFQQLVALGSANRRNPEFTISFGEVHLLLNFLRLNQSNSEIKPAVGSETLIEADG